jgi:UDP-N-acetylmuramoyl-L-alanyl-D-glutamate--2,6-diaminopimelate ligase
MVLNKIIENIEVVELIGNKDIEISNIQFDSRAVKANDLFVAIRGFNVDGHKYVKKAIDQGATAIICEEIPNDIDSSITIIKVKDSSAALGKLAANFFGNPTENLKVVGVTGTNGKTTVATLLYQTFKKLGYKVGLVSTIENFIDNEILPSTHTTPDQIKLQELFAKMVDVGCGFCFMEVSSHSIHQHRISGINFDGAVFTNITHDHLDYHKTFKEYIHVKKEFFDNLDKSAFAITNIDDKNGAVILQNTKAKKITYAINSPSDYKTKILEHHFSGMLLSINNTDVWTKFIGKFNAYNLTAIYAVACELGQNSDEVLRILSALKAVNGRFEHFVSQVNITAIVDYAHTPDALQNVLTTINEIRNGNESLITVVGAGGNRDKTKRPEMAKIAAELSNKLILTSDNPRFEDPEEIIKEMEIGVELQFRRNTISITDRKEAIKAACMFAQEGDIILIAGKGHETYQEIEGVKHHFDDKEIINEQLTINN